VSLLWTLLGIIVLIVLHELGHFAVAKAVGMRVERFSLFFPPTIFRVKRGETEYAIGAIPAGGYVKITGMNPEEIKGLEPDVARRAYYSMAPWRRIAVILAGPGVNIAIAFVIFWAILLSGNLRGAATLGRLDESTPTIVANTSVSAIERGAPAAGVLEPRDRIVSVEGHAATVESTKAAIGAHRCAGALSQGCRANTPVHLNVRRAGREVALTIYPRYNAKAQRMLIGFGFGGSVKPFGVFSAAGAALSEMWHTTTGTITGFGRALTSSKVRGEVRSIVGITEVGSQSVSQGPGDAFVFLGYLSLILAVINLFPFLPLDGGHVLWSLAEKLRGKRVSLLAMYRFSSVGIVLLLFLVVNGVSNDISRLAG
jgi:regulator of sigma E protease